MGAIRVRVQTADKNITIVWKDACLWINLIIKTSHWCFRLKSSPLSIMLLSPSTKLFCLNQERNVYIKHCLKMEIVLNKYVSGFWCEREWIFFLKEKLLLIMVIRITGTVFCFLQINSFSLINGVVSITNGLLWWFYQLLGLSYWRHSFTAEVPLVSKWCNILNFTCFLEAKSMNDLNHCENICFLL